VQCLALRGKGVDTLHKLQGFDDIWLDRLGRPRRFQMVIPADEKARHGSLETDEAIAGRVVSGKRCPDGISIRVPPPPLDNGHRSELVPRIQIALEVSTPWYIQTAGDIPNDWSRHQTVHEAIHPLLRSLY